MAATDANLGLVFSGDSAVSPFIHAFTRDFVSPLVHDARNNNASILGLIPRSTKYVGGRGIRERVKFGRNPRQFTGVGDSGKFPDPGQRKVRWYGYRGRNQFGRFILSGKLMRAIGNGAADIDPLAEEMGDFLDDYMLDRARQLYSDGSGRLCEINEGSLGAATDATITMQLNQNLATGQGAPGASATGMPDEAPTRRLLPGMYVLIVTAGGLPRCICEVHSIIDADEARLIFRAGATDITDMSTIIPGDWVVKTGSLDNSSNAQMVANSAFKHEPMGLMGIIGYAGPLDGTGPTAEVGADFAGGLIEGGASGAEAAWQWGITDAFASTSTNFFQGLACLSGAAGWSGDMTFNQGVVLHNSGTLRTPTENLIQRAVSSYEERNSAQVDFWVSSYGVKDTYSETLTGEKRFVNTLDLKGGWSRMLVAPGGAPWMVDREAPHNLMLGCSLETGGFMQWVTEELSWASEQGANIWQYLQDTDIYQARTVEEMNIGVGVRDRCGLQIKDLEET